MLVFIKLILAHVITDFLLQPRRLVELKTRSITWSAFHAGIFCLFALLLFSSGLTMTITISILLIGVLHFTIDTVKTRFFDDSPTSFITDQALHVLVIGAATLAILKMAPQTVIEMIIYWLDSPKFLVIVSALIIATAGGAVFISTIMRSFLQQLPEDTQIGGLKSAGLYIGIFERLIVLALTLTGNFIGIGIIFAAKSVIRFPEASSEKHFAEYYLIGTLTSFAIALLIGLVARYMLGQPTLFG